MTILTYPECFDSITVNGVYSARENKSGMIVIDQMNEFSIKSLILWHTQDSCLQYESILQYILHVKTSKNSAIKSFCHFQDFLIKVNSILFVKDGAGGLQYCHRYNIIIRIT